jgi:CDP-glycerol glycerophosphotransferase
VKISNVIKYLQNGTFLSHAQAFFMLRVGQRIFTIVSILLPVNKKKIVLVNAGGKGYGDNPKYIAQYFLDHGSDFVLVWLVRGLKSFKSDAFPESIRLIEYYSFNALYELATAGVWIDNWRKPFYPLKKRNQLYIQTWHGGLTAIKKIEKEAVGLSKSYIKYAKKDSKIADYMLSGCKERTDLIKRAFWFDHTVLEIGEPRADILLSQDKSLKNAICNKYNIPTDDILVLYAPTFRDANFNNDTSCYSLDFEKIRKSFYAYFHSRNITILMRLHPNVTGFFDSKDFPCFVKNVSHLPDMQELLFVSDVLITDYSDVQFYFTLMKKPVFLFTPDLEDYVTNKKGLYHDFAELPFPIGKTNDELCKSIDSFDLQLYKDKIHTFINEQNYVLDGQASKKIYEIILQHSRK